MMTANSWHLMLSLSIAMVLLGTGCDFDTRHDGYAYGGPNPNLTKAHAWFCLFNFCILLAFPIFVARFIFSGQTHNLSIDEALVFFGRMFGYVIRRGRSSHLPTTMILLGIDRFRVFLKGIWRHLVYAIDHGTNSHSPPKPHHWPYVMCGICCVHATSPSICPHRCFLFIVLLLHGHLLCHSLAECSGLIQYR